LPDESQLEQGSLHPVDEQSSTAGPEGSQGWQDRALRLQAEMDTFRRHQRRIAKDQIRIDQERLLSEMLSVVDNLDRTLAAAQDAPQPLDASLRQGVALTRNQLLHLLDRYDVQRIHAYGKSFDPHWHKAVAVVPAGELGVETGTVIQVTQSGYRRGERLFRPASVVVAQ
jgi:molecular chaperone GrpE